ncbi:MAG: hypothetical protein M0020_08865 [Actinomycetota bacterium]|nr:hypothetical protein [Actinomycetota bacterium]
MSAAGAGDEEHRVDHLTARDLGRRTPATGRVEEVAHRRPRQVGEGDREAHAGSFAAARVTSPGALLPI